MITRRENQVCVFEGAYLSVNMQQSLFELQEKWLFSNEMAKKGCVFRNYEYLITVLGDSYSTCVCLPVENVTTFTHTAAEPELKCNSSSVICYFQLVSQVAFVSVATNVGPCVHTRQRFRFQGRGIRVWVFFFPKWFREQPCPSSLLPPTCWSHIYPDPLIRPQVWMSLYGCRCLQFIDGVSGDRRSRVTSDGHVLTQARSC